MTTPSRLSAPVFAVLGLLLVHGVLCFEHTMWLWGINTQRFLSPVAGWGLWMVWALSFFPPLGARLSGWLDALGRNLDAHRLARLAFAIVAAGTVLLLDDRTWFTGDFLIRRIGGSLTFAGSFVQAMPLERLVFGQVPLLLPTWLPASVFYRALGSLSVVVLALAAIRFGRTLGGPASNVSLAAIAITFGGHLVVATGLGKAAALLCALIAVAASYLAEERMSWSAMFACGVAVAIAILLHRAGWLLLPCWGVALAQTAAAERPSRDFRYALLVAGAALPIVAGIVSAHIVWKVVVGYDFQHHLGGQPTVGPGEWWTLRALPLRTVDVLNLAALLLPLLPVAIATGLRDANPSHGGRWLRLSALALPWGLAVLLIRPGQGVFRDLDVFAPAGAALGAFAGLAIPRITSSLGSRLSAAVALAVIVPTLQLLLVLHDEAAGFGRVIAYAVGPPRRTDTETGLTWDFLALRAVAVRDWAGAVSASEQAIRYEPSPRMLTMRGVANAYTGDYTKARDSYAQALLRNPNVPEAWFGLAGAATFLGDSALRDTALARLARLPSPTRTQRLVQRFRSEYPAVYPGSESPQTR